jgi:hypothetical protein
MEGKARNIFPIMITGIIVFVVRGVGAWTKRGFRFNFVGRWLSTFIVGRPVVAVAAFLAIPLKRRATQWLVVRIDGFA